MCTVSWLFELTAEESAARFELFFNRDESRSRGSARPPEVIRQLGSPAVLAPIDSDAGGSWLAANDRGLVVALLNLYQARGGSRAGTTSRGVLPIEWGQLASVREVRESFAERSLDEFAGFRLLAFDATGAAGLGAWFGDRREWNPKPEAPIISSGFSLSEVERARRATYSNQLARCGGTTSEALRAFHSSTQPEPGPLAVRMTRDDARTVSTTRVLVGPESVEMHYASVGPQDGDWSGQPVVTSLPRSSRPQASK